MKILHAIRLALIGLSLAAAGYAHPATTLDFETGSGQHFSELTLSGATFTVDLGTGTNGTGDYEFPAWFFLSGRALELSDPYATLAIEFSRPVTTLQLDVAYNGADAIYELGSVRLFTVGGSPQSWDYFDVPIGNGPERRFHYSGAPIQRAEVGFSTTLDNYSVAIDNVVFEAVPVPEPSSHALLLAGLFLLAWAARRRG